ncbi:hypothetical protein ACJD0Z_04640 [Flavobacteriaceae bacterium M23B6Z8]
MRKCLIIEAFKKAEEELKKRGKKEPSKTAISDELSAIMSETGNTHLTSKSLRSYYDTALVKRENEDIKIPRTDVVQRLCEILGFENYEAYTRHLGIVKTEPSKMINGEEVSPDPPRGKKPFYIILLIFAVVGSAAIFYISPNKPRWMIWQNDHYTEASFDPVLLKEGKLKLYKEDKILYFRKVKGDCQTDYFDAKLNAKIWYGKNEEGKLELFTDVGLHPETGVTLKPITLYMIEKYLCESY